MKVSVTVNHLLDQPPKPAVLIPRDPQGNPSSVALYDSTEAGSVITLFRTPGELRLWISIIAAELDKAEADWRRSVMGVVA